MKTYLYYISRVMQVACYKTDIEMVRMISVTMPLESDANVNAELAKARAKATASIAAGGDGDGYGCPSCEKMAVGGIVTPVD